MGVRASQFSLLDCQPPASPKQRLSCWHQRLSTPSYNYKWTDLHYAASQGNLNKIKELLHKSSGRSNLNEADFYGKTPLYWAAYKGHRSCMEELLRHGAQVNTQCRHGSTPLHAVASLYPECSALLIKYGADVNLSDFWGVTPMYVAASNNQLEIIRQLIYAGAKLTYKNIKTGNVPKGLANHTKFCEYLESVEKNPGTLQQLTRVAIRGYIGEHPHRTLHRLPLPKPLLEFLMMPELEPSLVRQNSKKYQSHHIMHT